MLVGEKMGNEQKKLIKKFCLYIQNGYGGDDIQKWGNLSNFWKILALGYHWCSSRIQISIVFMRVSVTSTVICVDKVLSISLDTLSDADSSW